MRRTLGEGRRGPGATGRSGGVAVEEQVKEALTERVTLLVQSRYLFRLALTLE